MTTAGCPAAALELEAIAEHRVALSALDRTIPNARTPPPGSVVSVPHASAMSSASRVDPTTGKEYVPVSVLPATGGAPPSVPFAPDAAPHAPVPRAIHTTRAR